MTLEEFETLVGEALDSLPPKFGEKLNNVSVVVDVWPSQHHLAAGRVAPGMTLFGLYEGIPQTKRSQYMAVLPDKITIFAGPIVYAVGDDIERLRSQVKKTVLHEIGHHFGMNEAEIRKAQGN